MFGIVFVLGLVHRSKDSLRRFFARCEGTKTGVVAGLVPAQCWGKVDIERAPNEEGREVLLWGRLRHLFRPVGRGIRITVLVDPPEEPSEVRK